MKTTDPKPIGDTVDISLALIDPDPKNRKEHDGDALKSLAASIKSEGLLQPVVVRPRGNGRYMLIAGERRFRACALNKASSITARVVNDIEEQNAAVKRLVENTQREDLTAIEEARGFRELVVEHKMKQAYVAQLANRSQPYVANALRILDCPAVVQQLIQDGKLTRAHGVALARFAKSPKICIALAEYAVSNRLASKQLEGEGIPYVWELETRGIVVGIRTTSYSWDKQPSYVIPEAMKKDPDFLHHGGSWYCLAPEKWAPERERQDKARQVKDAEENRKTAAKNNGKTKEQLERARTIAKNKAARQKLAESLAAVRKRLAAVKTLDPASLALITRRAGHHARAEHGAELGIKLPPKFYAHSEESWGKLPPADAIKLAAYSIAAAATQDAMRSAGMVPTEVTRLLSAKGGAK